MTGRLRMHRRSALDSRALPPALLRSTPRPVRLNASGFVAALAAAVLPVAGLWGTLAIGRRWTALFVGIGSVVLALGVFRLIRRQWSLLEYGRPAAAVVTSVQKKRDDNGTYWRVHYEWTLLSGAKRQGRYTHRKKPPPVPGARVAIVYDRDQPQRSRRYPFALVRL
jgi:uncharacterized protein DUF3592